MYYIALIWLTNLYTYIIFASFSGTFDFSKQAGLLYAIINCNITQLEVYKMQLFYIPKSVYEVLCFFHSSQKSAQLCLEKKKKEK